METETITIVNQAEPDSNHFFQVPVINKTESLYKRDPGDFTKILDVICPEAKKLLDTEPYTVSVKTDGTCGMVCRMPGDYFLLMRRQDIKVSNKRNYELVINSGSLGVIAGMPCFISQMYRGTGGSEKKPPVYIFQLDANQKPEIENGVHIIGFTPLLHDFGEDKYAITAIKGRNGDRGMKLYTTVFTGSPDVQIKTISAEELLGNSQMMTVEIMGSKIANRYGFTNDRHFINPHGSIPFPKENYPPIEDSHKTKIWFENDSSNRWANVEGFVIHFPNCQRRFKLHRGHIGIEDSWKNKKESGFKFIFVE